MEDEDLDALDAAAQPTSTVKSTEWAMRRFTAWMKKRQINVDLASAAAEELAPVLRRFYAEVKTTGGQSHAPQTMIGIRAGIQRYLTKIRANPVNITKDTQFEKANSTFKAKCKLYAAKGNRPQKRKEEIAPGDLQKIHKYLAEDITGKDPRRLLQAVWFIIAFNLGCRGREIYRQLKKSSIIFAVDDAGQEYAIIDQTVVEKNHQGGPSREDQANANQTRIYDCAIGPHSVLGLLKLYLEKLHDACEWLFQQCRSKAVDGEPWYKNEPLGVNSLGTMMKVISQAAALSKPYTNHCVRATTITVLFNGGVDIQSIQSRTGHRSLQGIQPYIGQITAERRRSQAAILHDALGGSSTHADDMEVVFEPATVVSQTLNHVTSRGSGAVSEMMSGGNFHDCVFNIHINK